jgi:hypothetical protein
MLTKDEAAALALLGALPGVVLLALLALLLGGSGFKRLHLVLAAASAAGALWALAAAKPLAGVDALGAPLALALARLALPAAWAPEVEFGILVAPFGFLVALGCYALLTVGRNLYVFNDCEEASEELTRVRLLRVGAGVWELVGGGALHPPNSLSPYDYPATHTHLTLAARRTWRPRSGTSRQRASRPAEQRHQVRKEEALPRLGTPHVGGR